MHDTNAPTPVKPYWPALDGIRGLAVLAVLFFHGAASWAVGGYLGVSLFFTLSGFLITNLLLSEHRREGSVAFKQFWLRRAKRLVPASIVTLALCAVVIAVVLPETQRSDALGDLWSSLFNMANWRTISRGVPYVDLFTVPSPVEHFWSLAIEEQFYLVFPLVAAISLRTRPSRLGWVLTAAIAASIVAQHMVSGVDRAYFGTDTRIAELAVGGLLAVGFRDIRDLVAPYRTWLPDVLGIWALTATLVLWWKVPQSNSLLYQGGLPMVGVVSAALIYGAVDGLVLKKVLSFDPLVVIGKISYGVYLLHFPIYILLSAQRTQWSGPGLLAARVGVSLAAGVLSFVLIERPIRFRRRGAMRIFAGAGVATALAGIVAATLVIPDLKDHTDLVALDSGLGAVVMMPVTTAPSVTAPASTSTTAAPTTTAPRGRGGTSAPLAAPTTAPPATTTTTTAPRRAPRLLVVGDSTAERLYTNLATWGKQNGRLAVAGLREYNCMPVPSAQFEIRKDWVQDTNPACFTLMDRAVSGAKSFKPDLVLVVHGNSELCDLAWDNSGNFHHLGEPEVDSVVASGVPGVLDKLAALGAPVLWATLPVPNWDMQSVQRYTNGPVPGSGPILINDPNRTARFNQLVSAAIGLKHYARMMPYNEHLVDASGTIPKSRRPDGLHLADQTVIDAANSWLWTELVRGYRTVLADPASQRHPNDVNLWSP